jgi:hypothetical protein
VGIDRVTERIEGARHLHRRIERALGARAQSTRCDREAIAERRRAPRHE